MKKLTPKTKDYRGNSAGFNGLRANLGLKPSEDFSNATGRNAEGIKPIKPRNENPQGMQRAGGWSTLSKEELIELNKKGELSGVELSRRLLAMESQKTVLMNKDKMLDGFVWFIQEREKIRKLKEQGCPRPWTDDEIMDKTKFTNIFREDDKVSKFIFDKVKGMEGEELMKNLMVGRFVNRTDALSKVLPNGDLSVLLEGDAVFLNSGAYQLSPGLARLNGYDTVREFVVYEVQKRVNQVLTSFSSTDTISEASAKMNKAFGGSAPFVFFQIALDWHYLTGELVDSPVIRVGQGASPIMQVLLDKRSDATDYADNVRPFDADLTDLLEEVNQKVDRKMKPSDLEHAACEYRKYLHRQGKVLSRYSYKPNSMGI